MDTKHIKISDYNYDLPDERIAKFPIAQRDHSKLLVYKHGEVSVASIRVFATGRCGDGRNKNQQRAG